MMGEMRLLQIMTARPPAPIQLKNYPFPVLLYLEWTLLGIVLISLLLPNPFGDTLPLARFWAFLSMLILGLMGLRLPQGRPSTKLAYATLQIGLLLLASWWGGIRGLRLFPLLCVVLMIRNCLIFQLAGRLVTSALLYFLFLVLLVSRLSNYTGLRLPLRQSGVERFVIRGFAFNSALLLLLVIVFLLLLMQALITERQSRNQLTEAHDKLRQYAFQVERLAATQERNRIAREIHDSLGHSLTALNLQLEGALKLWQVDPSRAQSFLQEAKSLGSEALQDVRRSVTAARADPLQGVSLPDAILRLAQEFSASMQPLCQLDCPQPLPPDLSIALYRIVQEALTNIRKHATATAVQITLQTLPDCLHLSIQDNGSGFHPEQNPTGFGLQGMQERAATLGGQLKIHSAPGQGCQITARFPLPPVVS